MRNTPTGVGKTLWRKCGSHYYWKHPHGRGEDSSPYTVPLTESKHPHGRGEDGLDLIPAHTIQETPPRAWGRLIDC